MKPDAVRLASVWRALKLARSIIVLERREQLGCFTMRRPLPSRRDAYTDLIPGERLAIRRFDRALNAIDAALDHAPQNIR
jgi:hypothetical protein